MEKAPKQIDHQREYRDELITTLHKSQDTFEKQLSYIAAGSLALSIGFIKDIVNIGIADYKGLLVTGWVLLGITLLANCISHIRAADLHSKTINEINYNKDDPNRTARRYREISCWNWGTVVTLVGGIGMIIFFVSININK